MNIEFSIDRRTKKLGWSREVFVNGKLISRKAKIFPHNGGKHLERIIEHEMIHLALWEIGISTEIQKKGDLFLNKIF